MQVINELNQENKLTVRIAYNLFTQRPGHELEDFENWTKTTKYQQGNELLSSQWRRGNVSVLLQQILKIFYSLVLIYHQQWKVNWNRLFDYLQKMRGLSDFMLLMMNLLHAH